MNEDRSTREGAADRSSGSESKPATERAEQSTGSSADDDGSSPWVHPLRRCTVTEHHSSSLSRVFACVVSTFGIAMVLAGAVGLLVQPLTPDALPSGIDSTIPFTSAFGVFLTGLALLGRKRLVDRLLAAGRGFP